MKLIQVAVVSGLGLFSAVALAQGTHPATPATPAAPAAPAAPQATPAPAHPAHRAMSADGTGPLEEIPSTGLAPDAAPLSVRHLACARLELTWTVGAASPWMPSTTMMTVENRAGTTGIRLFTTNGAVTAVETFEEAAGGISRVTTLPGVPRIDYVDCQDGEPALGGIVVETYDAKALRD